METNRQVSQIKFKTLLIFCDGVHTHVIADGTEIAQGCQKIIFEHDASGNESEIALTKTISLKPENNWNPEYRENAMIEEAIKAFMDKYPIYVKP